MIKDRYAVALLCLTVLLLGLPGGTAFGKIDFVAVRGMYSMVGELDKNFFGKPYLVYMLNGVVYGVAFYLHKSLGNIAGADDFRSTYYLNDRILYEPIELEFHFLSLILNLIFSAIGLIALYYAGKRVLNSSTYAFLASFILATSLYWVVNEHNTIVDLPFVALLIVLMLASLRLLQAPAHQANTGKVFAVGLCFGLATAAKYPAALLAVPIGLAIVVYRRDILRIVKDGAIIAATALITFALLNPYIFLRLDRFLDGFTRQAGEASSGQFGSSKDDNFAYYATAIIEGYGLVPLLLALIGAICFALHHRWQPSEKILLLMSPLLFYVVFGSSQISYGRYMLPVAPFLALLTCIGIWQVSEWFADRDVKLVAVGLLIASVILPNLHGAVSYLAHLYPEPTTVIMARGLDRLEIERKPDRIYASIATREYVLGRDYIKKHEPPWFPDPKGNYDIVVLDTASHRGFVSEWADRPGDLPLYDVRQRTVVQVSQTLARETSAQHATSTLLHILDGWRASRFDRRQGPMIELYFRDPDLARRFSRACNAEVPVCFILDGEDGFFARVVRRNAAVE